jgi:hypothetical protein
VARDAEEAATAIPVASSPKAGFTAADIAGRPGWYIGEEFAHPQYSDFTDLNNWNHVGVVRLSTPITGIAPARLAPLNQLDKYRQPKLNSTLFTVVGYGTEVRKPVSGPQKPTPMSYPLVRRSTDAPGQKLTARPCRSTATRTTPRGWGQLLR